MIGESCGWLYKFLKYRTTGLLPAHKFPFATQELPVLCARGRYRVDFSTTGFDPMNLDEALMVMLPVLLRQNSVPPIDPCSMLWT